MAIFTFQVMIVLTIFATRILARRHVLTACLAWTAFTVLAVFASRLMAIQLVTIWMSYLVFRPKRPLGATKTPATP